MTDTSPLLALVDATADVNHPEFEGGHLSTLGGLPLDNRARHGDRRGRRARRKNGVGILGVWPGARALNVPLPDRDPLRELASAGHRAARSSRAPR